MDSQLQGDDTVIRPLAAIEEVSWTFNAIDTFNAAIIAHIRGGTTLEDWRKALDAVQRRHGLLSVSIEITGDAPVGNARPFFRHRSGTSIPLRVVPWDAVTRWEDEVERELGHPFETGTFPLIRATLIHDDDRCILILAAAHAISDGVSLSLIVRDLLTALATGSLETLPFPPSTEALLGLAPADRGSVAAERLAAPRPERRAGHPAVMTRRMDPAVLSGLLEACRRHGCTVQSALVAASVQALRRCAPAFVSKPVHTISPMDVRTTLGAGDANGMYIVLPSTVFAADHGSFWEMAHRVRADLQAASERTAVMNTVAGMRSLIENGLTVAEAGASLDREFALDVLITNLGRVPYPTTFGPLTLELLCPMVMNSQPMSQALTAATVGDTLCLGLISRHPVPDFLETVIAILSECGGGEV